MIRNLQRKITYILNTLKTYRDWHLIFVYRVFGVNPKKIVLRNGIVITGGPKSLILDLIQEIFIDEVYNPDFVKIEMGDTVMDIGANIGVFSIYAAKKRAGRVYSIEPLSKNVNLIRKNFRINKLSANVIDESAVSNRNGITKLYLGDLDSHGLLFDHNYNQELSEYILVRVATLNHIFKKYRINHINFLKIDCEGSEGDIIRSTPKRIWMMIDKMSIEYHDGVSTLTHNQILNRLKQFGYKAKIRPTSGVFGYIYAWR